MARSKRKPKIKMPPGVYMPCMFCQKPTTTYPLTNSAALRSAPEVCKECRENGKVKTNIEDAQES